MTAVALAFAAAVAGVAGAWECLAGLSGRRAPGRLRALLAPIVRAGEEGRAPSGAEQRRLGVLCAASLFAAGWLIADPLVGAGLAAVGPGGVLAVVRARRARYAAEVRRGAAPAARALAGALGAGRSVRAAISDAAGDVSGPAGYELRCAGRALTLGEPTDAVLDRLRRRAHGGPWDTLVAALALQREAGGDLAGLLRELAGALEAAARAEHDARVTTAQARVTARIVAFLPLAAAAAAELMSSGFLGQLLGHPLSLALVLAAGVLQVTALVLVRRIVG